MDRRELLDRAARDEDERLLLGRVWDKWEQCRLRSIPTATEFLSPQEQAAAQRLLGALGVHDGYVFFGGYDGAERQRLFFLPDWAETPDADAVAAVAATWYGGEHLTHRDFLGSLMGLGLTRGTIGDILVTEDRCQVLTLPKTAEFLLSAWESAGRVRLKTAPLPPEELERRCEALGANFETSNADLCARFDFAPRYPVWLKVWFGDEEFPASGHLFVDASAPRYLTIEDAVTVGSLILDQLTGAQHWAV